MKKHCKRKVDHKLKTLHTITLIKYLCIQKLVTKDRSERSHLFSNEPNQQATKQTSTTSGFFQNQLLGIQRTIATDVYHVVHLLINQ